MSYHTTGESQQEASDSRYRDAGYCSIDSPERSDAFEGYTLSGRAKGTC